jgi:putative ABC transport system permease protein
MENVSKFLAKDKIHVADIYPIVRGRLITLNGRPIQNAIPEAARNHNALHRDLNISSMTTFPDENKIVSGAAWNSNENGKLLVSVEKNMASDLHLKLGDKLGFQFGDEEVTAAVSNIRSVDWGSFHPNFYIIFPPETLDVFPSTFITSFHLASNQAVILNQLVREFPSVTVIDIASVLKQIQGFLSKISSALQYIFIFAILAAALIFIANLLASMDERRETYRLLRVLGASRKYIIGSLVVEFGFLGCLTLLFSYTLASIISHLLITMIF